MTSARLCPQCGRPLPSDAPAGVCPQCLLGIGMRSTDAQEPNQRSGSFVPPEPAQLAEHFPQLEILDLVGHGGMGAVYRARQRGLDRLVALKILPPESAQDPSFAERFSREARALAKLSHPNIVAVHDSGCAGGHYYLLMEYVDGVNLREAIQTKELTPEEALAIVPQICEALQYAHDEGVVHRDIKPENILLDKRGAVKIADFGLARLLSQAPDNFTLTGTQQVMGTLRYMAPEQMEGSHEVDHRADIFSLGVVFYEMLTGELPLGRFDAPSKKVQVDVRLDEIVLRTLEKEPSRRYQTASQIKTDIETIHGATGFPPHMQGNYGYEYRSKTTVFGWPLVHICQGPDPRTGRKRVAKGVIAVGDLAIGVIAFGGVALGGFTFGGASIGLFSFGGLALGLLLAIGGAAIGIGASFGGFAVGTVAVGGGAFGIWRAGAQGTNFPLNDPTEQFMEWITMAVVTVTFVGVAFIGLVTAIARRHVYIAGKPPIPPVRKSPIAEARPSLAGCLFVAMVLALGLVLALFAVAFLSYTSTKRRAVAQQGQASEVQARKVANRHVTTEEEESGFNAGYWDLTSNGPTLTHSGMAVFKLYGEQATRVNQVLQSVYRDYLKLEAQHSTESVTELNHQLTQIDAFSEAEIAELEGKLWSRLDEILNLEQQETMRRRLAVHVGEGSHLSKDEKWKLRPGILGWGRSGASVELWQVGSWYHWKASVKNSSSLVSRASGRAPVLPAEFRRFWREEAQPAPDSNENAGKEK